MKRYTAAQREADVQTTGGLGSTFKMGCKTYGLPAIATCPVGARLAQVPGTPCFNCYARKGRYVMSNVKVAQRRREAAVREALKSLDGRFRWVEAMVRLIGSADRFRWHDSGDVFEPLYFDMIVEVARRTPGTRHWLPTQERHLVKSWVGRNGALPENLVVRVSMPRRDPGVEALSLAVETAPGTSTVSYVRDKQALVAGTWQCPAPDQDGQCRSCRACWDGRVKAVSYKVH